MPSEKSARVSLRKAGYNRRAKRSAATAVVAARRAIAAGERQTAIDAVRQATSALDRVAKRGTIHRNSAARRKARLAKRLHGMPGPGGGG